MVKDVGTAIRKSIVVSFLPCLVAFLGFHPYMVPHFFFCNLYMKTRGILTVMSNALTKLYVDHSAQWIGLQILKQHF